MTVLPNIMTTKQIKKELKRSDKLKCNTVLGKNKEINSIVKRRIKLLSRSEAIDQKIAELMEENEEIKSEISLLVKQHVRLLKSFSM